MHLLINKEAMFYYSAILNARCGDPVHVHYDSRKKPQHTQLDEHEMNCEACKESYRTGIIPDYQKMHEERTARWMREWAEEQERKKEEE